MEKLNKMHNIILQNCDKGYQHGLQLSCTYSDEKIEIVTNIFMLHLKIKRTFPDDFACLYNIMFARLYDLVKV